MSITDELREYAEENECESYRKLLTAIADRIDERHERGMADAELGASPTEEQMAELGWVRKNKEHVISHATVEVTPYIDWSRMADELDEFVEIVRGMAGGAE